MRKVTMCFVAAALFIGVVVVAVRFAPPVNAGVTMSTEVQTEPGVRCTRLMYPKKTPKEVPIGSRCARLSAKHTGKMLPNQPPAVSFGVAQVEGHALLMGQGSDPDGDSLLYTWSTSGGRITGDGPKANWDLAGLANGTYTATVEVDDGCGCIAFTSKSVWIPYQP